MHFLHTWLLGLRFLSAPKMQALLNWCGLLVNRWVKQRAGAQPYAVTQPALNQRARGRGETKEGESRIQKQSK